MGLFATIDGIAHVAGYVALAAGALWALTRGGSAAKISAEQDCTPSFPRRTVDDVRKALDDMEPAGKGLYVTSYERDFDLIFERRGDRIDCLIEHTYSRRDGIGSGDFIYVKFRPDDLASIASWVHEQNEGRAR